MDFFKSGKWSIFIKVWWLSKFLLYCGSLPIISKFRTSYTQSGITDTLFDSIVVF